MTSCLGSDRDMQHRPRKEGDDCQSVLEKKWESICKERWSWKWADGQELCTEAPKPLRT